MANSLPGSPIVGFYNDNKEDFEEHNRVIDISNGKFNIKDTTRPYGFVDLNAKAWFQWFTDDGVPHEYLMTEGYLWTGQYPECQRVIEHGNNQSMELDEKTLNAHWTKDDNGKPQFFIINEAIISKLCILGENVEPCFEGSQITKFELSFDNNFKQQLFSMMKQLTDLLNEEGGTSVFTTYAVEIGDSLWNALYSHIESKYADPDDRWCSMYRIDGVFEENGQKFAVLQHRSTMKYYRLDFAISEADGFVPADDLVEVTKIYQPAEEPQFAANAVETFEAEYAKKKKEDNAEGGSANNNDDPKDDGGNTNNDDDDDEKKKKVNHSLEEEPKPEVKYNLDEIPEYVELNTKYSELETKYNILLAGKEAVDALNAELTSFKLGVEKKDKEAMIASFYMLSDEDKKDVIDNIDTYSLDDIEAKLSILCVRNKVNFNLDDDTNTNTNDPVTYNLSGSLESDSTPAWVKSALAVSKTMN